MRKLYVLTIAVFAACLTACAVNPVTGDRELVIVNTGQEVTIGEQQYGPGRQMNGGDYVVDPELTRYVADVGFRLAAVSDRQLPYEFKVINDSTPNAWALPGGKIAIHRGLLIEMNSEAELAAVLGHEIVHAAARHGAQSIQRGMLLQGAMVAASIGANQSEYGSLLMTAAGVGAQLINQRYGRDAERESDKFGMLYMSRAGYDPSAAVDLQQTFLRLSQSRPQRGWLEGLFASHPPSAERVENNRAYLAELNSGGKLGRDEYQQRTAELRRLQPAYDAHDRGRKALAEGNLDAALAEAQTALAMDSREALFHALRGDVRSVQKRWDDAVVNYNRAAQGNPSYFYPLMRRGIAFKAMNQNAEATQDLEQSIKLLPTAPALNALGELRVAAGNRTEAIELFRAASKSNSPSGQAAARSLMILELPEKPYLYIKTRVGTDASGGVLFELQNPTEFAVTDLELQVQYQDATGQVRQVGQSLRGTLRPGTATRIALDSRIASQIADPRQIRAGVSRARLVP